MGSRLPLLLLSPGVVAHHQRRGVLLPTWISRTPAALSALGAGFIAVLRGRIKRSPRGVRRPLLRMATPIHPLLLQGAPRLPPSPRPLIRTSQVTIALQPSVLLRPRQRTLLFPRLLIALRLVLLLTLLLLYLLLLGMPRSLPPPPLQVLHGAQCDHFRSREARVSLLTTARVADIIVISIVVRSTWSSSITTLRKIRVGHACKVLLIRLYFLLRLHWIAGILLFVVLFPLHRAHGKVGLTAAATIAVVVVVLTARAGEQLSCLGRSTSPALPGWKPRGGLGEERVWGLWLRSLTLQKALPRVAEVVT